MTPGEGPRGAEDAAVADQADGQFRRVADAEGLKGGDVVAGVRRAGGVRTAQRGDDAPDHIVDVGETTQLGAAAGQGDRVPGQRGGEDPAHGGSRGLLGAVYAERPHDGGNAARQTAELLDKPFPDDL